ncbi:MAG: anthranilate synthase component I family protein [Candidatus Marinimicrobia bacterium]|nr:anthranilate synthase component I family protein [Candidatus Neomarinimicrobiota bacterium]
MLNKFIKIKNYEIHKLNYENPIEVFENHAHQYGSVVLTGKGDESNSRFSMIGFLPNFEMVYDGYDVLVNGDPVAGTVWNIWHRLLHESAFHELEYPASLCGFVGFASYELGKGLEFLPKTTIDSYTMPVIQLLTYENYIIFDHSNREVWHINFNYESTYKKIIQKVVDQSFEIFNIQPEANREEYKNKVTRIKNYILEGDVYEVNLTQQIKADFNGDGFSLFKRLYSKNDAPYSCYFNLDRLQIVSNSPELFLKAIGKSVETRPIKGTISRSDDPVLDNINKGTLLNSEKDQAELFMIIDLLRNDLGKVSNIGSVKVINSKKLECFKNVFHLVGIVESELSRDHDYIDLIRATFPGGSITGCPKIRSMEIIDELETYTRNLYTGSIFIMNREFLNSSIVIRTAVIKDQEIFINSGGAITIDSDPEQEYQEMTEKIKNIMESLGNDCFS